MLNYRCAYAAAAVLLAGVFFGAAPESGAMTVPMTVALAGAGIAADDGAALKVGHRKHYRYYKHRRRHYDSYDDDDDGFSFNFYGGPYYGYPYLAFPYGGYYSQPNVGGSCGYWRNQCARNWGYRNRNYYGCLRYQGCR